MSYTQEHKKQTKKPNNRMCARVCQRICALVPFNQNAFADAQTNPDNNACFWMQEEEVYGRRGRN